MDLANIAVIGLARRYDRMAEFFERFRVALPVNTIPVTAWAAVDDPYDPDKGCLLSHIRVLSAMDGPLVVFEDDACFSEQFTLDLDPPGDWDILWLGGQHKLAPAPHNATWVTPRHLVRTHAYIAREPSRVAQMLRGVPRIDPHMANLRLRQYALKHHTVGQRAGRSDISGTIRPVDEYWQRSRQFSRP